MISFSKCFALALIVACGGATVRPSADDGSVAATLDAWHEAAAGADEEAYFAAFADDGVFLGTDATERWDVAAFRRYAHPHFERGEAWSFRATRRAVVVEGDLAYFDEDLATEGLGPARGSGVLRRSSDGWRIVQYNLTLTIPNERFGDVRRALAGECASEADVATSEDERAAPEDSDSLAPSPASGQSAAP